MAINISQYLPVTSTVETILNNTRVFAGLGLSENPLIPTTNPMLQFKSLAAVGTYFGTNSSEYQAATKYFATSTTSLSTPAYIYFGKYISVAISPYLRSGIVSNTTTLLASLVAITAGDLTVSVNGTTYATTGINLSASSSLSAVAAAIQADIWTAYPALNSSGLNFTITFNASLNQFVASIPATGSSQTMNYFSSSTSPNLANTLGFTLATNAVLSQGSAAVSPTQNMTNLLPYLTDQFTIAFVDTLSGTLNDAINLAVATFISAQGDAYAHMLWSNDVALESSTDTTSIWYQVNVAGLNNIAIFDEVLYNNSDRAFAAMGIFAAVDLSQPNSAITLAFKTQTGLLPSVSSTSIAQILDNKTYLGTLSPVNYYGNVGIGGSSTQINWFYSGACTGKWSYIDNLMGQIWIAFQSQVNLANLFSSLGQVVNDPDGYGQIRSSLTDAMNSSITNGIIAIGVVFSNATVQQLQTNFGISAQELTNNGYVIVNSATSQALRQIRESSPWFIIYVKGSAIQYLPINTVTYY